LIHRDKIGELLEKLTQYGSFTLMYLDGSNLKYKGGWVCQPTYFEVEEDMIKETLEQAIVDCLVGRFDA
jgi:hypothetical protein